MACRGVVVDSVATVATPSLAKMSMAEAVDIEDDVALPAAAALSPLKARPSPTAVATPPRLITSVQVTATNAVALPSKLPVPI